MGSFLHEKRKTQNFGWRNLGKESINLFNGAMKQSKIKLLADADDEQKHLCTFFAFNLWVPDSLYKIHLKKKKKPSYDD